MILEGTHAQKRSAQDTLYTCLEGALLLMHPFMPYVTEELWQRLPRRPGDKTATVCKAAYPRVVPEFDNEKARKDYDLVFDAVKAIRSLTAEYNIKDKAEGKLSATDLVGVFWLTAVVAVHIHAKDPETFKTVSEQKPSIQALVRGLESIAAVSDGSELPDGLTANVISDKCTVYLMVKGRVDVDAEIGKAQKKIVKLEESRKRLEKAMAVKDYQTKVKLDVQELDRKRLVDYLAEEKTLEELIGKFEQLRG